MNDFYEQLRTWERPVCPRIVSMNNSEHGNVPSVPELSSNSSGARDCCNTNRIDCGRWRPSAGILGWQAYERGRIRTHVAPLDSLGEPMLLIIRNCILISLLIIGIASFVSPKLAYAMPCCSDLDCEGTYGRCVQSCAASSGGQSCMDSCRSAALACAQTRCSSCGNRLPCWMSGDCNIPSGSGGQCGTSWDCTSGFVCVGGSCESGSTDSCDIETGCNYPYVCQDYHCVQGGCLAPTLLPTGACQTNRDCASGAYCVNNKCQSCPQSSQECVNGFCQPKP